MATPRILYVDSYDSFAFNLVYLLIESIPDCSVYLIQNDGMTIETLTPLLKYFDATVVGPGPGSPEIESDTGLIKDIWRLDDDHVIPVFGVCFGLQSLGVHFNARLHRMKVVKHGQLSEIIHNHHSLFEGAGPVVAVRYHSLHVTLDSASSQLRKIGWAFDKEDNGEVVMAVEHARLPFCAVQYHPESTRTTSGGTSIVANLWKLASLRWAVQDRRPADADADFHSASFSHILPSPSPLPSLFPSPLLPSPSETPSSNLDVDTIFLDIPSFSTPAICETFGVADEERPFVLLDSGAQGRFTIIGCSDSQSIRITYFVKDRFVSVYQGGITSQIPLEGSYVWT
ncbi:Anthranilate synthase component II [Leucoagaricus sp. SymC.cos]|nr:Anthranilate synthase component II [Leucoagaricus sp. SymC.cos]